MKLPFASVVAFPEPLVTRRFGMFCAVSLFPEMSGSVPGDAIAFTFPETSWWIRFNRSRSSPVFASIR